MKLLLSISLIIILSACGHTLESNKFLNADLKYSSYLWHLNQDMTGLEFSLFSYIHIDSSGRYKLIRHTTLHDNPQYFAGTLTDSVRKIIDSILYRNRYLPEIRTDGVPDTPFLVYDGFTYLLDYKIIGKDRTKVQYINSSSRTPKNILFLTSLLDTLIFKRQANKIHSFSIGSYIDTLKKISSYNLPPPPKRPPPPNISTIKFIPPKPHK
jgi:hypothetical protein